MQLDINDLRMTAQFVGTGEIDKLRIEEELLYMMIKNPNVTLSQKNKAFERIKDINRMQILAMGQCLGEK